MGRKKPGKPRRIRVPRQYSLRELNPPGTAYREWFQVQPGMDATKLNAPSLSEEATDLMRRLAVLGPVYGNSVPRAALSLDQLIDTGRLPIIGPDGTGTMIPVEELAPRQHGASREEVRESIHQLHSVGALLVEDSEEQEVSYVRMVAKRPSEPGEKWHFAGEPGVAVATTCVPTEMWGEIPSDVATAVMFLRSCRSQLREPDPDEYGRHASVNGPDHARELFAAAEASGYVDFKGCDACPAGHLCTREDGKDD
ncbi:hypothetical protein ACFV9D_00140 [Streptomyces sp. NPDC059875]|uniref:hypothetical protein n=1 Tax=unclassified Streptomyces TaxID=2593676 RepID=UPI00364D2095